MKAAVTLFKACCIIAVPVAIFAFYVAYTDNDAGFLGSLINALIFGGMVVGFGFVWLFFAADIESSSRPARSREEQDRRDVDALMGYVATDDKAWHDLWGD